MSVLTRKPKTLVDVYRVLREGTPIQVINNQIYISPSPRSDHLFVSREIFRNVDLFVTENNLGDVIYAPVDVFPGHKSAVQPDVFFIANANNHLIKEDGIYGPPDLIVEILSPGNRNTDLVKKKTCMSSLA